jgi:hypothetical protein
MSNENGFKNIDTASPEIVLSGGYTSAGPLRATVWHCDACEIRLRVYSRPDAVGSEIGQSGCPRCYSPMRMGEVGSGERAKQVASGIANTSLTGWAA